MKKMLTHSVAYSCLGGEYYCMRSRSIFCWCSLTLIRQFLCRFSFFYQIYSRLLASFCISFSSSNIRRNVFFFIKWIKDQRTPWVHPSTSADNETTWMLKCNQVYSNRYYYCRIISYTFFSPIFNCSHFGTLLTAKISLQRCFFHCSAHWKAHGMHCTCSINWFCMRNFTCFLFNCCCCSSVKLNRSQRTLVPIKLSFHIVINRSKTVKHPSYCSQIVYAFSIGFQHLITGKLNFYVPLSVNNLMGRFFPSSRCYLRHVFFLCAGQPLLVGFIQ